MKKTLLILSLMLTSSIYSQVISVKSNKTYMTQKHGELGYLEVLKNPDSTSTENNDLKYVNTYHTLRLETQLKNGLTVIYDFQNNTH